jgi:uncharacterized protein (DUF305 family)
MTRTRRALTLTLVLLTTAAGVSACSEAETPVALQATPKYVGTAAEGEHNQADVDFAKKIFPYHIQANVLAGLGQARGENQQIKELAASLADSQAEATAKFGGWLTGWQEAVPAAPGGPLEPVDVEKLGKVDPASFDVAWLAMVIKHQQASLKAIDAYEKAGQNTQVEEYAQKLEAEQRGDLSAAKQLLKELKG